MTESAEPSQGRIFISYRREETAYSAGWLFDRLADHFGGQVFKDVDSIEPGDDWVDVITRVVGSCDVLLALIGDKWLTITNEDGLRRLDDPGDFVRLEIETALTRNVRVIPILVAGAKMPRAAELPPSLAKLARRQALVLSPANFDTSRLLGVLHKTLAEVRIAEEGVAAIAAPADQAPDRSTTKLAEAPAQPAPGESSGTPTVPPATPTAEREVLREDPPVSEAKQDLGEAGPPPGDGHVRDEPPHRFSRRVWIAASAGVALAIALVVALFVGANQGSDSVVFDDDFSNQESGWTASVGDAGRYKDDAYHVRVDAGVVADATPQMASSVYPSAPPRINIKVDSHLLTDSSQPAQYGLLCRYSSPTSWYAFTVEGDSVSIWTSEDTSQPLAIGNAQIDADGTNELVATCEGNEEQGLVYLQLLVNGKQVVQFTDDTSPLPNGSVGMFADGRQTQDAVEVQFDDFEVTHV